MNENDSRFSLHAKRNKSFRASSFYVIMLSIGNTVAKATPKGQLSSKPTFIIIKTTPEVTPHEITQKYIAELNCFVA